MRHLAADVRRIHARAVLELELRVWRVDDLDDARALVRHGSVPRHLCPLVRAVSPLFRASPFGSSRAMALPVWRGGGIVVSIWRAAGHRLDWGQPKTAGHRRARKRIEDRSTASAGARAGVTNEFPVDHAPCACAGAFLFLQRQIG